MRTFFILISEIILLMNLRIVKPVNITGDNDERKSFNSKQNKDNDKEPIKIIEQTPKNYSVNFNSNEILIVFNKRIFLNSSLIKLQSTDSNKNVTDIFNVSYNADQINLKFKNKPKQNATYIITFLDGSIIDFNRNTIPEFSIIFSTGNKIDDFKLRGYVYDLMTQKEAQDAYVFLYKLNQDEIKNNLSTRNIINNNKPDYFTKTNIIGYFNFENLSPGVYFICAGEIIDKENFMSDPNVNKYGFDSNFVKVDKNSNDFEKKIYILKSLIADFKIVNDYYINSKYYIEFNDKIKDFNIDIQDKIKDKFTIYSKLLKKAVNISKENTIEIDNDVLGLISTDFLPCELNIKNISGDSIKKNILIKFDNNNLDNSDNIFDDDNENKNDSNTDNENEEFKISCSEKDLSIDSIFNFEINSNKKIISTDKKKINIIISDSYDIVKKQFTNFNIIEENDKICIKTNKTLKDILDEIIEKENVKKNDILNKGDIKVSIFIDKDAFTYSDFKKNKIYITNFLFLREYKSLEIRFNIKTDHFILQLLDDNYEIIKETNDTEEKDRNNIVFKKIKEGKYFIRYFLWNKKKDKDDKWFKGNINKNQPNDILKFYDKPILINNDSNIEKIIID